MKHKILSIILAVAMLLNTSVIPVFAAEDPASSGLDSGIAIGTSGLCDLADVDEKSDAVPSWSVSIEYGNG